MTLNLYRGGSTLHIHVALPWIVVNVYLSADIANEAREDE